MSGNKRGVRRLAAVLVLAIGTAAALLALSTSASAEEEYVQEKTVTYSVDNLEGGPLSTCKGTVFIGQTASNSIEATNSVDCKREFVAPLLVRSYVGIFTATPTPIAKADDGCFSCRTYTVSTSVTNAAPGSYCAIAFSNVGTGLTEGRDTVCIKT